MILAHLHQFWFENIELTEKYYERQIKRWFFGIDQSLDHISKEVYAPYLDTKLEPFNAQENLARIILLDQIPRNAFRNDPRAYAFDHLAQKLALNSLGTPLETELSLPERIFLYMPFQHAENLELQELSVDKFYELHRLAPKEIKSWTMLGVNKAIDHLKAIQKNGRFLHRLNIF